MKFNENKKNFQRLNVNYVLPYFLSVLVQTLTGLWLPHAEILVGRRSGPDREKCSPDRVIYLAPDQ